MSDIDLTQGDGLGLLPDTEAVLETAQDTLAPNQQLRLAAALILGQADTLATEKTTCACCGLAKYTDKVGFNLREQMDAMVAKLARLAGDQRFNPDRVAQVIELRRGRG